MGVEGLGLRALINRVLVLGFGDVLCMLWGLSLYMLEGLIKGLGMFYMLL